MDVESISIQKNCIYIDLDGCGFGFYGINQTYASCEPLLATTYTATRNIRKMAVTSRLPEACCGHFGRLKRYCSSSQETIDTR